MGCQGLTSSVEPCQPASPAVSKDQSLFTPTSAKVCGDALYCLHNCSQDGAGVPCSAAKFCPLRYHLAGGAV